MPDLKILIQCTINGVKQGLEKATIVLFYSKYHEFGSGFLFRVNCANNIPIINAIHDVSLL